MGVFSNSLDHALSPYRAIGAWMDAVAPHGILIVEHSSLHTALGVNGPDIFGATLSEYIALMETAGAFHVTEVLPNPHSHSGACHFVVVQHAPDLGSHNGSQGKRSGWSAVGRGSQRQRKK